MRSFKNSDEQTIIEKYKLIVFFIILPNVIWYRHTNQYRLLDQMVIGMISLLMNLYRPKNCNFENHDN